MIKSVFTLLDPLYSGGLFPPLYSRERTNCSSYLQRKFKLTFQSNIVISDCYFLSETNLSSKSVSMKLMWVLCRQFGLNHRQVLIGLLQRYSDISDVVSVNWGSSSRSAAHCSTTITTTTTFMYSCTYVKKLLQRGKLNEVRVLVAWNNYWG